MILRIIAALMVGIAIGVNINNILDKQNGSKTQILEELVTTYEMHEMKLKEEIIYYKTGMHETLEQNINLMKKLSDRNQRRI